MTIIGAIIIAYTFNINVWKSLLGFFILGEILHYVFGTQTAFLTMIGVTHTQCASSSPTAGVTQQT
jgi:hypothetical protein